MNGKSKCKILKDIRRQIAADNDIDFVTSECKYQGECSGTCPKCEAEVRYLEQELAKRQNAGKAVAVAGIAATILVSTAGCLPSQTAGEPMPNPSTSYSQTIQGMMVAPTETDPTGPELTMGEEVPTTTLEIPMGVPVETEPTQDIPGGIPYETEPTEGELMGEPMPEPTEIPEIMGDMVPPQE